MRPRRGITLLEVLISMFVLLIGLLGVAALIPAGRSEIMAGVKTDYGTVIGRAATRDVRVRGFLAVADWQNSSRTFFYTPATSTPTVYVNPAVVPAIVSVPGSATHAYVTINGNRTVIPAVVLDPFGCATGYGAAFPSGVSSPSLFRIYPSPAVNTAITADPIFRCSDDLTTLPGIGKDAPPIQQMTGSTVKRSSGGNYSWIATIVPELGTLPFTAEVTVSIAVFYKRNLSSPGAGETAVAVTSIMGGEAVLTNPPKQVRAGQWIMLAAQQQMLTPDATGPYRTSANVGEPDDILHPAPPAPTRADLLNVAKWYRVVSAEKSTGDQAMTLNGPEWPFSAADTTAWLIDDVIGVYTKAMRLELP